MVWIAYKECKESKNWGRFRNPAAQVGRDEDKRPWEKERGGPAGRLTGASARQRHGAVQSWASSWWGWGLVGMGEREQKEIESESELWRETKRRDEKASEDSGIEEEE